MSAKNERFCNLLKRAIDDEDKASDDYGELVRAGLALTSEEHPDEEILDMVEVILKIKDQENSHEHMLEFYTEKGANNA